MNQKILGNGESLEIVKLFFSESCKGFFCQLKITSYSKSLFNSSQVSLYILLILNDMIQDIQCIMLKTVCLKPFLYNNITNISCDLALQVYSLQIS